MRVSVIFTFLFSFFCASTFAQHVELIENKGELGVYGGVSSYNGDIAPDKQNFSRSMGVFYKRQVNEYVGFRLNMSSVNLSADDKTSSNAYAIERKRSFARGYTEFSLMSELYFNRFITKRKNYLFTPYFAFGAGYIYDSVSSDTYRDRIVVPVAFGFKYNFYSQFNLFGEFMYRFTFTDNIDHLVDGQLYKAPAPNNLLYQGSRAGNDEFFNINVGISYNFRKVWGIEPRRKPKFSKLDKLEGGSGSRSGFISLPFFKRN